MKTYAKNIVREIRSSFGRFMSIFAIVALGTGFLAGLAATSPDMMDSVDRYYDESDMPDLEIFSTLGITQEDVDALSGAEGISAVMPVYRTDLMMDYGADQTHAARLLSFPENEDERLNRFTILEGTLPRGEDECAVVRLKHGAANPRVGSTLKVNAESETEGIIKQRSFKVTAVVDSAYYFSTEKDSTALGNGTVSMVLFLPEEAFDMEVFTEVMLSMEGGRELNTFGKEYTSLTEKMTADLENIGTDRCQERYDGIREDAQKEIDAGWEEYNSQKVEADRALADAKAQLDGAKARIDVQEAKLSPQIEALRQMGQEEQAQQIEDQLEEARTAYAENQTKYENNRADSEKALAEAEEELRDAENKLSELEVPEWYIRTREDNLSYASFDSNSRKVAAIAVVFPVFFFMVAALVALTTMTRMVEEQRVQIGTLKALGYGEISIAMKYLLYAGTATIAGSAAGLSVGLQLFPRVLWNCYGMMYNLPPFYAPFRWEYALLVFGAVAACILLSAYGACRVSLRECAAALMLPKAPKAGKRVFLERITPIWKRMRFTHKVTVRNLLRYKKRFFMTIIGIGGCTALLLTGFGLSDSINAILDKQYGELNHYDMMVMCKSGETEDARLREMLEPAEKVISVYQESCHIASEDSDNLEANIFVPQDPAELPEMITLRNRRSGKSLTLSDDGVILTEKAAETLNISVGESLQIENGDGEMFSAKVCGITENYAYTYVYMTPGFYEKTFGEAPDFQLLLVLLAGMDEEAQESLANAVLSCDAVSMITKVSSIRNSFRSMVVSIDYIVLVLIVCAGLLAFVVLYNLMNINITERERELATIKVLGFYEGEVGAYVYRETLILSVLGTAAGLVAGIFLHAFVVRTAEVDVAMFGREIEPMSFVWAAVLTMVFSIVVCLVMFPKLKKINMVESLKSIE